MAAGERPWVHEDENARPLTVERDGDAGAIVTTGMCGASVLARYAPEVAREICERAGADVLIFSRPGLRDPMVPGPHGDETVRVMPSPARRGDLPGVMLLISPAGVRLTGDEPLAVAAALADAWREANGPDEARALAGEIEAEIRRAGGTPGDIYRIAAQTALRYHDRQQRGRHW